MSIERLSVVDVGWPGEVRSLVPALEQLGYHRYWTTEHYSPNQSSSPTLLAGIAAECTSHIRIGTAGVLLNLAPPLRVVNDFSLLELLYPGRVDLGVAGSTGGEIVVDALLQSIPTDPDHYQKRVREVARLQRITSWNNHEQVARVLGPLSRSQSPLWVCGTGHVSAQLAGEVGAGYAFHDHLSPANTNGPDVLDSYRQAFKPSVFRSKPEVVVACTGTIGETEAQARADLQSRRLKRSSFVGTLDMVDEQLNEIAERYGTAELALQMIADSLSEMLDGYRALADRNALSSPADGLTGVTAV